MLLWGPDYCNPIGQNSLKLVTVGSSRPALHSLRVFVCTLQFQAKFKTQKTSELVSGHG